MVLFWFSFLYWSTINNNKLYIISSYGCYHLKICIWQYIFLHLNFRQVAYISQRWIIFLHLIRMAFPRRICRHLCKRKWSRNTSECLVCSTADLLFRCWHEFKPDTVAEFNHCVHLPLSLVQDSHDNRCFPTAQTLSCVLPTGLPGQIR